jgi:uncharacterized integral membrane protein
LAGTWLPAWCVSCYEWSICWMVVMCLKKIWLVFLSINTDSVCFRYIKLE